MIIEYTSDISNLITNKADLVDGKVPAEQLPSYVDDVIEFNNIQVADAEISSIIGNNLYKNQIRFVNNSTTLPDRIGSEDKYPNMFVNFGENTSEDDWTTFEPEKGKIYVNTTNNHSYRWSGSYLIDLDQSWSNDIKDLQENTVSIKSQTLTEAQQAQVWQNLGLDLVVLKFPKGVTSITLTDEEDAKLQLGAAVLVTADSTDTTSNIYNANNHIFTTIDFKNTSQPLYYSLALFSGLLYCSYNKVSKKFTYNGIIRLIDTGAVRFDRTTPLTSAQQEQAFKNLGWKVHVISKSVIGSSDAVSDDEKATRISATALLVQETGVVYNFGVEEGGLRKFFGLFTNSLCNCLFVDVSSGAITTSTPWIHDQDAVSFTRNQSNISNANKNKALGNIGLGFVIVNYSELATTLSDDRLSQLVNAKGIILTNTPDVYIRSVVFTAGTKLVNSITFSSIENFQDINYIVLNIPNKILSLVQTSELVVSDSNQNLSNTQKDTVLSNIGLNWIHVQYSLLDTTLDDATYAKIKNAYGIILTDVPSDYFGPREFICGSNNSDGTKVFAGLNLVNTSAYIVLYVNHNLTNVRYARTYDGAVPYDASKTLTSAQQDVALSNIGLNFVHVSYSLLGTTITDEMFAALNNAKGIILVGLPSNYYNPFVFIKGNNTSTGCIFVGFATGTTYCQIKLDKSTKILSNINANLTYIGTVRYIEKQSLTDTQKQQARSNIGATSCYDEYKLAGGTKYTTEADFNAQLVKVMDMTVVE